VVNNPEARSRFLREMKAAGKLRHPNIVRALDAEQIGDLLILVMEFVPGIPLDHLGKQRGPLPVDYACNFIAQAGIGLQHAHEKGMVHRDIKPANLMVTAKDKEVKLLDFGLVSGPSVQTGTKQTQLQAFMGTPDYVAPEQATDASNVDIRADVYSLGCTFYFLLAGRPPFQSDSVMNTLMAQVQDEARPLTELRKDVPAELSAVVAKMMAKNPADRYQTPIEAARALKPFLIGTAKATPENAGPAATNVGAPPPPPVRAQRPVMREEAEESPFATLATTEAPASPHRRDESEGAGPVWKGPRVPSFVVAVGAGLGIMSLMVCLVVWSSWTSPANSQPKPTIALARTDAGTKKRDETPVQPEPKREMPEPSPKPDETSADIRPFPPLRPDGIGGKLPEKPAPLDLIPPAPKPGAEKNASIRIVAVIDGTDRLRITEAAGLWFHGAWTHPNDVKINELPWNPQASRMFPKAGTNNLFGKKVKFPSSKMTKNKGRGGVWLAVGKDWIDIHFDDPAPGADVYDVTITIPFR
jgi:hypothetical protein